jgi:hypothetical protein
MARITHGVDSEETYLTALIFCEKVITDRDTASTTLVSTFNIVEVPSFPAQMPNYLLYVAVARGRSEAGEFYIGITAPNGRLVLRSGFIIQDWGEALTSEFAIPLAGVSLPIAGLYVVRVFVGDRVLMERYIDARTTPQSPPEQDD